ncbi:MAG: FecR domain-containing protein, partial [Saprospiraceae bacterium]|nr:FecR domain-containing protein [Saprospiraceae bacterium]
MSISKYILFLHHKLKGNLSEASANELDHWRKEADENEVTAQQTEKAWELGGRYKSGFQPDTSAGFAQLKAKMQAAEAKVVPLQPRRNNRLAVAASIALLAGCFAVWQIYRTPSAAAMVSVTTKAGERREIKLPDGSQVVLNENSSIAYVANMQNATSRRLNLSGEAYFDITEDPNRPFIIATAYATVRVLGTAFNVRAYREEPQTEVEVERGKVALEGASADEALVLSAGQRGLCRPDGSLDRTKSPELPAHSWRTGKLEFRGTPMTQVAEALERHYKIRIELDRSSIAHCPFSGNFSQTPLEAIMETIAVTLKAKTTR